ncbi:MAG: glucose 1-dehydrogenase [Gammaproteobacteria bacterium]|nr:glucose 1-dehydrogenase [Gammaproteobacteria bacterium]
MGGRVQDKVALITGAASGLGKASAIRLAEEGASVVLTDINVEAGERLARDIGPGASFHELDTTSESGWDTVMAQLMSRHGRLDVLFNNAGVGSLDGSMLDEMSFQTWRKTLAVNLDGVFLGLRAAIRAMKQGKGGSIINTSSIYGIVGAVGVAAYNASKGGVRTLTKGAALECARANSNIRVNSIHPGHIETPMIAPRVATDELRAQLVDKYPIGHLGEPLDIANAVLFLASDESRFMTGAELVVDGGFLAQ